MTPDRKTFLTKKDEEWVRKVLSPDSQNRFKSVEEQLNPNLDLTPPPNEAQTSALDQFAQKLAKKDEDGLSNAPTTSSSDRELQTEANPIPDLESWSDDIKHVIVENLEDESTPQVKLLTLRAPLRKLPSNLTRLKTLRVDEVQTDEPTPSIASAPFVENLPELDKETLPPSVAKYLNVIEYVNRLPVDKKPTDILKTDPVIAGQLLNTFPRELVGQTAAEAGKNATDIPPNISTVIEFHDQLTNAMYHRAPVTCTAVATRFNDQQIKGVGQTTSCHRLNTETSMPADLRTAAALLSNAHKFLKDKKPTDHRVIDYTNTNFLSSAWEKVTNAYDPNKLNTHNPSEPHKESLLNQVGFSWGISRLRVFSEVFQRHFGKEFVSTRIR